MTSEASHEYSADSVVLISRSAATACFLGSENGSLPLEIGTFFRLEHGLGLEGLLAQLTSAGGGNKVWLGRTTKITGKHLHVI